MKYVLVSGGVISGIGKGTSFLLVELFPVFTPARVSCLFWRDGEWVEKFDAGVVEFDIITCRLYALVLI